MLAVKQLGPYGPAEAYINCKTMPSQEPHMLELISLAAVGHTQTGCGLASPPPMLRVRSFPIGGCHAL